VPASLGQTTTGTVGVAQDHVRLEVQLPWLLSMLANKAKALVEKQGKLMLEKPVKPSTTRSCHGPGIVSDRPWFEATSGQHRPAYRGRLPILNDGLLG
jgi:hypothetical protein